MSKRIYRVQDKDFNIVRLVRAGTPAQAVGHVARNRFDVRVASQDDIVEAKDDGVAVETAGEVQPAAQAGDPPSGDQPLLQEAPPAAA